MAEYIERESFKQKYLCCGYLPEMSEKEFDQFSAADVAEVVHGRWIHHDDGVFTCSECGNAESEDSYYCRLCGAKMDGGADHA